MKIAVFDYETTPNNPVGSCHYRMLQGLCREHDFVVFAVRFVNPCPQRIRYVRVPAIPRPLFVLGVTFYLMAPLVYWLYRLRTGERFDLIQTVEADCLLRGDIAYAHFCHRRYMRIHWPAARPKGLRRFLRWIDHTMRSLTESLIYRRAGRIVVPSRGLARELADEYPSIAEKIVVNSNSIDLARATMPPDFDRAAVRAAAGFAEQDILLVFVALGHFERKGLPAILQSMADDLPSHVKLHVIGGSGELIDQYRRRAGELNLGDRVVFAGMQKDVRPYLWSADAFILPSLYETFSLVTLEAAAAQIPVLVAPLHGVEEFVVDGANGLIIQPSEDGVTRGVKRLLELTPEQRREMGIRARESVLQYSIEQFQARWRNLYASLGTTGSAQSAPAALER